MRCASGLRTGGLALALWALAAGGVRAQLEATYLANEGFLLEGGDRKVLVDALFADGVRGYATLPPSMYAAAVEARPPFDEVDLILASHYHADHFDAETVVRHLRANPRALFLSTPQAVREVERLAAGDRAVLGRLEAALPPEGQSLAIQRAGLDLQILNLHHGRGGNPPTENLGFLVRQGGVSWLHVGDTEAVLEDFEPFGLVSPGIDVALLPEWFLDYDSFIEVVRSALRPQAIVVMHRAIPTAPAGYFGHHPDYESRGRAILERFPQATLTGAAGQALVFSPASDDAEPEQRPR